MVDLLPAVNVPLWVEGMASVCWMHWRSSVSSIFVTLQCQHQQQGELKCGQKKFLTLECISQENFTSNPFLKILCSAALMSECEKFDQKSAMQQAHNLNEEHHGNISGSQPSAE